MTKVIAVGPGGKAQAPARDDRARPVIEYVIATGKLDQLLLSPVCRNRQAADDLRAALYRSARYYCSCGRTYCTRKYKNIPPDNGCPRAGQRISCHADVVLWTDPADQVKKYRVQFRLFDKAESMRHVVARYGPDPNQWPYFSHRKRLKEGDT